MWLARISDGGSQMVVEIDDLTTVWPYRAGENGQWVQVLRKPKVWRFGERPDGKPVLGSGGWAAIADSPERAIESAFAGYTTKWLI